MTRLRCAIRAFIATLRGLGAYEFDGHVYDDARRYELRQHEFARCVECGAEVEQGWHRMGEGR